MLTAFDMLILSCFLWPIALCCSLLSAAFLCRKKQAAHASTTTPSPPLHGAMLRMWRKTRPSHRIRRQKTLQTKKAVAFSFSLVAFLEGFSSHKEKKTETLSVILINPH
jgi:hypothetical protein